jgi:hypothetical protein
MRRGSIWPALRTGLVGAAVLAVAGCIQLEQKLMLNGDGSMVVSYHYSVAADSEALLAAGASVIQGWQGRDPGGNSWFTGEDAVRRHFAAGGVQLKDYRSYLAGGRRHVELMLFTEAGPRLSTPACSARCAVSACRMAASACRPRFRRSRPKPTG